MTMDVKFLSRLNLGFLLVFLCFLLKISWRAWGNVVVDFPEELYVPWQLTRGKLLYRDIFHFYGPLSQYYHALLFKIFGVSFSVIIASNLVVLAGMMLTLFAIMRHFVAQHWAIFSVTCMLPLFLLGHADWFGSFNYMAPYAHEATHGTLLLLLQYLCLLTLLKGFRPLVYRAFFLLGGLVFLTKPELTLASLALVGFAFWKIKHHRYFPALYYYLLPLALSVTWFCTQVSFWRALQYTLGAHSPLWQTHHASHPLFTRLMGDQDPHLLFYLLSRTFLAALVFVLIQWGVARSSPQFKKLAPFAVPTAILVAGVDFPFITLGALFMLLSLGSFFYFWCKKDNAYLSLSLLSVLLLLRMALLPRIGWYGFSLAIPAFLLLLSLGLQWLPHLSCFDTKNFRLAFLAVLVVLASQFTYLSWSNYQEKTSPLGSGDDLLYSQENTRVTVPVSVLNFLVDELRSKTSPQQTLLTLPDTVILNYLARRTNPTPYMIQFTKESLFENAGGAQQIIEVLDQTKPDVIIYLRRIFADLSGLRENFRGSNGFAEPVFQWIEGNYQVSGSGSEEVKDFERLSFVVLKPRL